MIIPISLCLPPATYESLYVGNPALVSPGWFHNSQFTIGWLHDFLTPSDRHQIVCCLCLWFGKCVLSEHFLIGGNISMHRYKFILSICDQYLHNHVLCSMTRLKGDNHRLDIYTCIHCVLGLDCPQSLYFLPIASRNNAIDKGTFDGLVLGIVQV